MNSKQALFLFTIKILNALVFDIENVCNWINNETSTISKKDSKLRIKRNNNNNNILEMKDTTNHRMSSLFLFLIHKCLALPLPFSHQIQSNLAHLHTRKQRAYHVRTSHYSSLICFFLRWRERTKVKKYAKNKCKHK